MPFGPFSSIFLAILIYPICLWVKFRLSSYKWIKRRIALSKRCLLLMSLVQVNVIINNIWQKKKEKVSKVSKEDTSVIKKYFNLRLFNLLFPYVHYFKIYVCKEMLLAVCPGSYTSTFYVLSNAFVKIYFLQRFIDDVYCYSTMLLDNICYIYTFQNN